MNRSVIIVGAGPAGSVAALCLARRGWEVTIVEQHRFPREKVCGECISPLGIDVLNRLSISLPHLKLHRATFVATNGREATINLPREMWSLSRGRMDAILLGEARACGAKILQPHRCEAIEGRSVTTRDLTSNAVATHRADFVMRADGKAAQHTDDLGVKAHFEGVHVKRDTITMFGLRGHYVGLAPIEDGLWNIAMSVPSRIVRAHKGNLDALFDDILAQHPHIRLRFRSPQRKGNWLASPLPRFPVARAWPKNIIPLGNAAAALEPIGGEGIGLALRSAELAAITLDEDLSVNRLRRRFNRMWGMRRLICRAGAMILSSPRISSMTIGAIRAAQVVFPASAGSEAFEDDAIPISRS